MTDTLSSSMEVGPTGIWGCPNVEGADDDEASEGVEC